MPCGLVVANRRLGVSGGLCLQDAETAVYAALYLKNSMWLGPENSQGCDGDVVHAVGFVVARKPHIHRGRYRRTAEDPLQWTLF
jgi:hypothetical protein